MQVIECVQGTDEWYLARAGIPTASQFSTVMAKGLLTPESKTRRTYMLKLAGEQITGQPMESFANHHMERGKAMEDEARNFYAFVTDADPQRIGFIRNDDRISPAGCSPDSLIGENGMLEIKTSLPHIVCELILKDAFPSKYKAQTQGQLWIAGREWVDLIVYWPNMPAFIKRAYRDEAYIAALASAVSGFNAELTEIVERIRAYGEREAA